jgi:hypothetical protein
VAREQRNGGNHCCRRGRYSRLIGRDESGTLARSAELRLVAGLGVARDSRLGHGRYVRCEGTALGAGDGERAHLAGADLGNAVTRISNSR